MDARKFLDTRFGYPTREPGVRDAFTYYRPRPIPRSLEFSQDVVVEMANAESALGQLNGLATLIPEPDLLTTVYLKREAVATSRIEGTQASMSDLLQSEVDTELRNDDVAEINRYVDATRQAFDLLQDLPISQRLIHQVHKILMSGVRGEEKSPGEYRRSPVWIGSPGATPTNAAFVPPVPRLLPELMTDWETFVNRDGDGLPVLVHAALMHYQFETIHPFLDGNGRIGRLLINLVLSERKRLDMPLLYISHFFETHREEYYRRLQRVREKGDVEEWLLFFMNAIRVQAQDAVERSRRLLEIQKRYHAEAMHERSNLSRLVELMMKNPFVTVAYVEEALEMTNAGARGLIRSAEGRGWLTSQRRRGRGGREQWVASEIYSAIELPLEN